MQRGRKSAISGSIGERLSRYLRVLEALLEAGGTSVRSRELAQPLSLGAEQVRKDLSRLGQFGQRGVGYDVGRLVAALRLALGTDRRRRVAVIGAGRLGQALLLHNGLRPRGFDIEAVFDVQPEIIGAMIGGWKVHHMSELTEVARRLSIEIALLAVPSDAAQEVLDACVEAGIRGVLSFASARLVPPEGVTLQQVDLALDLERLVTRLVQSAERTGEGETMISLKPLPGDAAPS